MPAPDHQRGSLPEAQALGSLVLCKSWVWLAVSGVGISVWEPEYAWVSHLRVSLVFLKYVWNKNGAEGTKI